MQLKIPVQILPHADAKNLPAYQTPQSAGMDLVAALDHPVVLYPLKRLLIGHGIAVALPEGYEGQIRPRSGLALKHGITVLNTPGTIDADYRGELKTVLINLSNEPFTIDPGMRVSQLVIAPVTRVEWAPTESVEEDTQRSIQGFGSTGLSAA